MTLPNWIYQFCHRCLHKRWEKIVLKLQLHCDGKVLIQHSHVNAVTMCYRSTHTHTRSRWCSGTPCPLILTFRTCAYDDTLCIVDTFLCSRRWTSCLSSYNYLHRHRTPDLKLISHKADWFQTCCPNCFLNSAFFFNSFNKTHMFPPIVHLIVHISAISTFVSQLHCYRFALTAIYQSNLQIRTLIKITTIISDFV